MHGGEGKVQVGDRADQSRTSKVHVVSEFAVSVLDEDFLLSLRLPSFSFSFLSLSLWSLSLLSTVSFSDSRVFVSISSFVLPYQHAHGQRCLKLHWEWYEVSLPLEQAPNLHHRASWSLFHPFCKTKHDHTNCDGRQTRDIP